MLSGGPSIAGRFCREKPRPIRRPARRCSFSILIATSNTVFLDPNTLTIGESEIRSASVAIAARVAVPGNGGCMAATSGGTRRSLAKSGPRFLGHANEIAADPSSRHPTLFGHQAAYSDTAFAQAFTHTDAGDSN